MDNSGQIKSSKIGLEYGSTNASELQESSFMRSIKILLNSEKSLFLVLFINFATSLQFYILVTLIPLYFTSQYGFSDTISGIIFGGFGVVIGVLSIYLSSLMAKISFKTALLMSFVLGIIGFGLMMIDNSICSMVSIVLFQSVSCAIAWPYAEYAVKEYSSEEIRNLCSSCFFISNYLAGIAAGMFIDYLWSNYIDHSFVYFCSFSIGALALILATICLKFCKNIENVQHEEINSEGLLTCQRFLKYSFLILLLVLVRSSSFSHLDATIPKYLTRTKGNSSHFGIMLSLHSCSMIVGLLTLTFLTYHYSSLDLICFGAFLGSLGSIFIILSDSIYFFIIFVILISIGESIWVPRLLDYTFSIAPEGREGIYLAMSNCPFYFGMILTGVESGVMFDLFCDGNSNSDCIYIWAVVAASSLLIVFVLFLSKNFILNWQTGGSREITSEIGYKQLGD